MIELKDMELSHPKVADVVHELRPQSIFKRAKSMGRCAVKYAQSTVDVVVDHVIQPIADLNHRLHGEPSYSEALSKSRIDGLTGCYNRETFIKILDQQRNEGVGDAVLAFVDMVGLKEINNDIDLGHDVGDAALIAFSWTIREYFKEETIAGRLGGDEFVLALQPGDKGDVGLNGALTSYPLETKNDNTGDIVIENRTDLDLAFLLQHEKDLEGMTIPRHVKDSIKMLLSHGVEKLSARYNFQHMYFTTEKMGVQFGRFMQAHGQKYSRKTRRGSIDK